MVRNASALAAELMGRGTKKEWEKWAVDAPSSFSLSLSLPPPLSPGLFAALLFRLEPSYHPEDTARKIPRYIRRARRPSHSPYATITYGGKQPVSLSPRLSAGRQHNIPRTPSSAMDGKLMTACDRDVTSIQKRKY